VDRLNLNSSFHDTAAAEPRDPEISLGAATILGIFLALTLVCALFFGLGYSMGRRSYQPAIAASTSDAAATTAAKPASGSLTSNSPTPAPIQPSSTTLTPSPTATVPLTPTPLENSEKPKPAAAPAVATGNFLVQIAAVSHREDAESLITALQQRGYTVFIRNEPQDKLLHVQVGPFPTRKDADAMRQHLLYDGYNAIVK
jgi:DedD protein